MYNKEFQSFSCLFLISIYPSIYLRYLSIYGIYLAKRRTAHIKIKGTLQWKNTFRQIYFWKCRADKSTETVITLSVSKEWTKISTSAKVFAFFPLPVPYRFVYPETVVND